MPEWVSTECRTTSLPKFVGQVQVVNKNDLLEATRREDTLLVRRTRKKKSTSLKSLHTFGSVIHLLVNILNVNLSLMEDCITVRNSG